MEIYHEKQIHQLCALHALNNLLQGPSFTKTDLDNICYNLSPENWINPHKSLLGLGNYDVNVVMGALQTQNMDLIWFDKRKQPECLNFANIEGFILNIPSDKWGFMTIPWKRRHWVALRQIQGVYYNLDSKLEGPMVIGNDDNLLDFIRNELDNQDKELFIVVKNNEKWLKNESNYNNKVVDSLSRDAEEIQISDIVAK